MAKRRVYLTQPLVVDKPIAAGTDFWPDMEGDFVIVESNDPHYPHVASFPCESGGDCSEAWDKAQQVANDLISGKLTLDELARNGSKVIKEKNHGNTR